MSVIQEDRRGEFSGRGGRGSGRVHLRRSYPAVRSSVSAARRALAELAAASGAGDRQLDAIRLAASEALTNVVLYAYPGGAGQIHVTAGVAADELWILIADDGRGIKASPESDGLGLGLALISRLADGFSIVERSGGGTELQLRFVLVAGGSGRQPDRPDRDGQSRGSLCPAARPASPRLRTTT
jgi:anti-sigma regulatory factor (Ser/Thr protein kinase)